ncbi:hypothetical protein QTO34_020032 [Cnephaeus nilssonii]|uniref:nucleoside diphosphate phosphatase n=1 Tax=Cnephaeus nilssonii TaxID=3371016 RepID=A0AA40HXT4_CNENI|nr:hypothetical protein QTO34_020032 [Eptesicus nilssonii]
MGLFLVSTGEVGFEPCYAEVLRVVQGKLHQPDEIQRSSFYAFSYYYDRAVDTHMIDYEKGGILKVEDFERKAKEVCDNLENFTSGSPFLCMDLSYITALLKDGFGFADSTVLQARERAEESHNRLIWELGRKSSSPKAQVSFEFLFYRTVMKIELTKKVNNIETGWALGATFHLLQSLGVSH